MASLTLDLIAIVADAIGGTVLIEGCHEFTDFSVDGHVCTWDEGGFDLNDPDSVIESDEGSHQGSLNVDAQFEEPVQGEGQGRSGARSGSTISDRKPVGGSGLSEDSVCSKARARNAATTALVTARSSSGIAAGSAVAPAGHGFIGARK